jgi:hypothetical protein
MTFRQALYIQAQIIMVMMEKENIDKRRINNVRTLIHDLKHNDEFSAESKIALPLIIETMLDINIDLEK